MIKKAYIVESCAEMELAVKEIEARIPCFDGFEFPEWNSNSIIYWINCREPDLPFVEKMLASFI